MGETSGTFGAYVDRIMLTLIDREVTDTPGIGRVIYSFEGSLQGSQQATGNVVVNRFASNSCCTPISTESFPVTLRRQ